MSIDRVNDAELVARARQGDAGAFGELVDRHRVAVYRAALAALGSHADAEDAAQDAFVTAWQRLASFRGDATFKTWLLTIAWHHAINRRRSLSRWWRGLGQTGAPAAMPSRGQAKPRRGISVRTHWGWGPSASENMLTGCSTVAFENIVSADPTPEQAAADRELRRAIVSGIRTLPSKLRDTLLLAQAGDYSYEEIAAMLGTPAGTIKWRVSEARRGLRQRLKERGFTDVG